MHPNVDENLIFEISNAGQKELLKLKSYGKKTT